MPTWDELDSATQRRIEESLRRRGLDPHVMIAKKRKDKLNIRWGFILFWLVYFAALGLFIWGLTS